MILFFDKVEYGASVRFSHRDIDAVFHLDHIDMRNRHIAEIHRGVFDERVVRFVPAEIRKDRSARARLRFHPPHPQTAGPDPVRDGACISAARHSRR